jgi:hypothetical protein
MVDMHVSMIFSGRFWRKLNGAQAGGQSRSSLQAAARPLSYRAPCETFDVPDFAQEKGHRP